jgi:cytochrome c oxidase subunit 2
VGRHRDRRQDHRLEHEVHRDGDEGQGAHRAPAVAVHRDVEILTAALDADPLAAWTALQFPDKDENAALVAQGRALFKEKNCITCHSVRGHEGIGVNAPDLTHFGSRSTVAAGLLENNKSNLHRWIVEPNNVKPGNKMYMGVNGMAGYMEVDPATKTMTGKVHIAVDDTEARAMVEYLHSLK